MEAIDDVPGDSSPGRELAPKTRQQAGGGYVAPEVGSWHWVTVTQDTDEWEEYDDVEAPTGKRKRRKQETRDVLMYVTRVYSNHVRFYRDTNEYSSLSEQVAHEDMLALTRPEPNWRDIIMAELQAVQLAIKEKTAALLADAVKKNALPPVGEAAAPSSSGLELSVRIMDPALQKQGFLEVQQNLKETQESIQKLTKRYAALCKNLMGTELAQLGKAADDLSILNDKIFVIEVYAGLRESVRQIAEGDPARIDTRITVRQSMLYMDEETLIDYTTGGMDFRGLEKFDAWVCKPKNLNRVLPEKRGIVAFRVRRNQKDYGRPDSISEALEHMAWHSENFQTYLLIRNGGNVYRIASSVDFSPRLIPRLDEFENAFLVRDEQWRGTRDDPFRKVVHEHTVGPEDFDYDDKVNALKKRLGQYNKIVVLIQGLLDRSEVFHPHTPINLSHSNAIDEWLNLVRDEEDVVEYNGLNWRKYVDDRRALITQGTIIWCRHIQLTGGNWGDERRPTIITVDKVRKCNSADRAKYESYNSRAYRRGRREYDSERVPEAGTPGVEVSWSYDVERYSKSYTIPVPEKPGYYRRGHWTEKVTRRQWLPLAETFNITRYRPGDFRFFLADRRQKAEYETWTPMFFAAEDYYHYLNKL